MSSGSTTLWGSTRPKRSRAATLAAASLLVIGLAIGAPLAADAAAPTTLVSSAATATANGQITLTANGFAAGEALTFTLDSTPLPTYGGPEIADAQGHYDGVAVFPTQTTLGPHTITVSGTSSLPATTVIDIVAKPTSAVNPSTVALSSYLSNGVTATFSGFTPGSTVFFGIFTPNTGGPAGPNVVVGASGIVTLHFVPTAGSNYANPGTYGLYASAGSIMAEYLSFDVTANPVVMAPVAAPAAPIKKAASFTG